jgi:hypothetical protein
MQKCFRSFATTSENCDCVHFSLLNFDTSLRFGLAYFPIVGQNSFGKRLPAAFQKKFIPIQEMWRPIGT